MHPILRDWRSFLAWMGAWIPLAAVLTVVAHVSGNLAIVEAAAVMAPTTLVLSFVCLAPFYMCRSLPLRSASKGRIMLHHAGAAVILAGCVLLVGRFAASLLGSTYPEVGAGFSQAAPILAVMILMIYETSVALHYAGQELEASRRAEILTREAQLKALKAQVNPHFLFNSLNSISALTTIDPGEAREMCIRLADFLRTSLRLGERSNIPFSEEMALTRMYLDVEQVRFGGKLRLKQNVDPACDSCDVPALIIQPLVENAVKHGIAMMAEGGEIVLSGRARSQLASFHDYQSLRSGSSLHRPQRSGTSQYPRAAGIPLRQCRAARNPRCRFGVSRRTHVTCKGGPMKLRVVMADDEALARRVLGEYLAAEPDIDIVAECANGFDAVKAVNELKPDVVFLDVQMPKLDGFEVLELIDPPAAVVFVTAFDQYAMRAFDAAAVDYLLKPFSAERFRTSLNRVRDRLKDSGSVAVPPNLRVSVRAPGDYLDRVVVKEGPKVQVIPVGKLDYAEAQDDYVALRSEGRNWLKQQTLSSLETALDPRRFLRVHRSWLVNVDRIVRMDANTKDSWTAVLTDGSRIPVSRGGFARFREVAGG